MKDNLFRIDEGEYEVVWPLGRKASRMIQPGPRLDTLEGKTICEVWNMLFKGDLLFSELESLIKERYPGVRFVPPEEFGFTRGGQEESTMASLADNLARHGCDAVISSVGG
jgi:hypothetical protein